tara:strand:+ start:1149 stop:1397 length:249 start_codon:yes stop_codon:yes gene_type:complete
MNWLKRIWTRYRPPENRAACVNLFRELCLEAGVSNRDIRNGNLLALFEEWYDGACDKKSVQNSVTQFKQENPTANAKLQGKL